MRKCFRIRNKRNFIQFFAKYEYHNKYINISAFETKENPLKHTKELSFKIYENKCSR